MISGEIFRKIQAFAWAFTCNNGLVRFCFFPFYYELCERDIKIERKHLVQFNIFKARRNILGQSCITRRPNSQHLIVLKLLYQSSQNHIEITAIDFSIRVFFCNKCLAITQSWEIQPIISTSQQFNWIKFEHVVTTFITIQDQNQSSFR